MTAGPLIGAALGLGLLCLVHGLLPPRPDLRTILARLQITHTQHDVASAGLSPATSEEGWVRATRWLGRPAVQLLSDAGVRLGPAGLSEDLRILERGLERLYAEKAALALLGLLLPTATAALLLIAGIRVPAPLTIPVGVGLTAGGWVLPTISLRRAATRRRRDARHSLGAVLDLTIIALAGGAGVEGALHDAAQQGRDWTTARLRRALAAARVSREPPWTALGRLGQDWGVRELTELAASVGLAGAEGAKVRASLTAKASSLRAHQHADLEADAEAATERMALPVVLMLSGFLLFIGYPAVTQIVTGTQ